MNKADLMREIKEEVMNLKSSPLYAERVKNKVFPVIGEGSHNASIMFIGEAPGKNEAQTGRPFCGASGKVLDQLLDSISLKREDVYVTNIVKDRPTQNRDPSLEEIEIYGPFLDRQIDIIKPKILATLGRFSMEYILNKYGLEIDTIGNMHGTKISIDGMILIPLYHPAASIYNQHLKKTLLEDFRLLKSEK